MKIEEIKHFKPTRFDNLSQVGRQSRQKVGFEKAGTLSFASYNILARCIG
jgi:hypothetical protein